LLHGILLTARWIPGVGCSIVGTQNKTLAASFVYTMGFDAIVLALTAFKLSRDGPIGQRSRLVGLIFSDGVSVLCSLIVMCETDSSQLIYFIIAFGANVIATIFMLLDLNPVMSIIFNVPSAIASTIVASRAVRRLSNFMTPEPERFAGGNSSLAFRAGQAVHSLFKRRPRGNSSVGAESTGFGARAPAATVSVPMDTFSQARSARESHISGETAKAAVFDGSAVDLEAGYVDASPMADKEARHAF
jgi:hypothetical protein